LEKLRVGTLKTLKSHGETPMTEPTIFDLVRTDLEKRDRIGWDQHHRPLLAHDGQDSLREAYEEALDLAVYLRKALAERGPL
jgi:hypothetical protein